ncbi:hypothetical protein BS17DRAFT_877364 [Gyrodon lividus]|nr:hypothetical protein BS17DRAFT_877364 [Gyrodon lividus]
MPANPINIVSSRAEAQWLSMSITNWLENGIIKVQNPCLNAGKFLGDYPSREMIYGSVANIQIYPRMTNIVSACGDGPWVLGTTGSIDLFEGWTKICTLFWDCPGGGNRNLLQKQNMNGNYLVSIGNYNHTGAIGDVSIAVQRAH